MFNLKKTVAAFAAIPIAAALVAVGLTASPAAADPTTPPLGATYTYCGTGSDTTQDVVQKLSETVSFNNKAFASYNATGSNPISPVCDPSPSFNRPNGSSAGIDALRDALGHVAGPIEPTQLHFARSSRGPNTAGTNLTWIPFGVDAVGPAAKNGGALDTFHGGALTLLQLQNIYNCVPAALAITVGGVNYTVQPYVPQAGSGTRAFWLAAVGITEAQVNTTCVKDTKVGTGAAVQEHDGRVLTDPTVGGVNYTEIAPYSIAQYIAQTNSAFTGQLDRRCFAPAPAVPTVCSKLLNLAGNAPIAAGKINASWPSAYQRSVYNVFDTTKVTGFTRDPDLVGLFVGVGSAVCSATATINLYGFLTNASCGDTTLKGNR